MSITAESFAVAFTTDGSASDDILIPRRSARVVFLVESACVSVSLPAMPGLPFFQLMVSATAIVVSLEESESFFRLSWPAASFVIKIIKIVATQQVKRCNDEKFGINLPLRLMNGQK